MTDFSFATAQLAGGRVQCDRAFVGGDYVVVLDGASPHRPVPVSVPSYVDCLGEAITSRLDAGTGQELSTTLAEAIAETRDRLNLVTHDSPSSTVAMARIGTDTVDFLVLGDSLITHPTGNLIDLRLDDVAIAERRRYSDRLNHGYGYDSIHKELLHELQNAQVRHRNTDGGYWIAEAEPHAANHALTLTIARNDVSWFIISTDGAYESLEQLRRDNWEQLSHLDSLSLGQLLQDCHDVEAADPDGRRWPRAKIHDDKTIVVARRLDPAVARV